MYVCSVCGLKNQNGASGFIVLEEVSAQGDDTVVIGYCFRNYDSNHQDYYEIGYEPVVEILFEKEDGSTDTQMITNVSINDLQEFDGREGYYVSFSLQEAKDRAAEQYPEIANFTVCFTFVPTNGGEHLNFRIELD